MRIAIIIPRLEQLGPVKVIQSLVNSLRDTPDLQIRLFYLDKKVDHQIKVFVPVERLVRSKFSFDDYDIIHTNGIRPDLFAWMNRKKIRYHISTIHNFVFEDLSYTYNKLISLIFGNIWLLLWRRADKLVCVTRTMKNYYESCFASSKLEVIYNGVPETDINLIPDNDTINVIKGFRSKGLKVIGSAGILTKRKGIDQILYLLKREKNLAVIIIGDGKERIHLQSLANELNVSDRCHFCGFMSYAISCFKHFDFFIVPSRSEGLGLTLIEAVQQKVPVICSDIEVFRELFSADEVTFFKLDDGSSLTESLKEALETGTEKADLAYNRYQNNYTDNLMAKSYLQLYKSATELLLDCTVSSEE